MISVLTHVGLSCVVQLRLSSTKNVILEIVELLGQLIAHGTPESDLITVVD
jgi:hypothetical protein